MKRVLERVLAACVLVLLAWPAWSCTTIIVGKQASVDGSVLVSHSEDGLGDPRMVYIPAKDHEPGSVRHVYDSDVALGYEPRFGSDPVHRFNIDERSPRYKAPAGVPPSQPLGSIPQVSHTYAYFDGNYGLMNEHQLIMGECTDKAKVHPEAEEGKRIFYSSELSRVALERCKTAREAVKLMGELIMTYGYYGTGETLLVGDPDEGWVMEMCGYDMDGTDGVWVAQRVPDDGFFVAANQFRIREVKEDAEDMMYSPNIFEVAKAKGWWKSEDGPLDWTAVYGDGEFHHPYYSLRRVWRAQSLVAPSLKLSPWVEDALTKAYPFSIRPDNKLDVRDVMRIHRDVYEGTEFDLSKGLAAGPFSDPVRFEGGAEATMGDQSGPSVNGAFERPLSIYRCVYAYVCQARKDLPDAIGGVIWFGPDRPATSVLMPFYPGAGNLPDSLQRGNPLVFDRGSMWTAFNYVANYAGLKYSYMIKDITAQSEAFEARFFGRQADVEAQALKLWKAGDTSGAAKVLADHSQQAADDVLAAWWKLSEDLYIKYNDGYLNEPDNIAQPLFYPNWWLKAVGYENGPLEYKSKTR
ncbi:MAG: dipeptidase [Deltaproteobacteria bacterium]|nr:dipeptidase [Deltaproteobacteria bacterium]